MGGGGTRLRGRCPYYTGLYVVVIEETGKENGALGEVSALPHGGGLMHSIDGRHSSMSQVPCKCSSTVVLGGGSKPRPFWWARAAGDSGLVRLKGRTRRGDAPMTGISAHIPPLFASVNGRGSRHALGQSGARLRIPLGFTQRGHGTGTGYL